MTLATPRCAVVFKTYAWDGFVERQAQRFAEAAGALDFFISVDVTNGSVGLIPFERVVRFGGADLAAAGLPMRYSVGGVLWWNRDYAHYQFLAQDDGRKDLRTPDGDAFLHSVLDRQRYISSMLHNPMVTCPRGTGPRCRCGTQSLLRHRVDTVSAPGSGLPFSCQGVACSHVGFAASLESTITLIRLQTITMHYKAPKTHRMSQELVEKGGPSLPFLYQG
jgi:hypothetical protein